VKNHLKGQQFHSNEDVQNEIKKWLCAQCPLFFYEGLEKWMYHCDKCLNRPGDYVEK
jgi:hypothetical protein